MKSGDFRKTRAGAAICPFFTWTSENIEGCGHTEDDVCLTFCDHPKNIDNHEGNCQYCYCPMLLPNVSEKDDQQETCVVPAFKQVVGCELCKFISKCNDEHYLPGDYDNGK